MFSLFNKKKVQKKIGEYQKPIVLQKLESFQNKGIAWEHLGFSIDYNFEYDATPEDVIPFAGTGGDGVHFGFSTERGIVENLDSAKIVCVSPADEFQVKLVANSLIDFLSIVTKIGNAEFLRNEFENEESLKQTINEWNKIPDVDWKGNPLPKSEIDLYRELNKNSIKLKATLLKIIKSEFGIRPMEQSIVLYLNSLK